MRQSHILEKMMTNSEFFTLSGFEALDFPAFTRHSLILKNTLLQT
jgi:hypothetical protein